MKKVIVTTTINPITKALEKFIAMKDWNIIVVGDKKTPHDAYSGIDGLTYLHPDEQEQRWPTLSNLIQFNCIQRRNFGFLAAYEMGADIVATVDDDNIPYDDWGQDLIAGTLTEVDIFSCENSIFDPLSVTNQKQLWHRGYPWELIKTKNHVQYLGRQKVYVDIQAGLWDGDPDIDAVERIIFSPMVHFENVSPYHAVNKMTVFNSQNTFITRRCLQHYMMIPFVGRMDDIWGSYILQDQLKPNIVFSRASVYQERNLQCLFKNMNNELHGYTNNLDFINHPTEALEQKFPHSYQAFEEYRKLFA